MKSVLGGFLNWRTSLASLIAAAAVFLNFFGIVNITTEQQVTIGLVVLMIVGWFAKDSAVNGTATDAENRE